MENFTNAISQTVFFYVLAFVMAAVEIESEGAYGWADKAPTWYRKTGLAARLYGLAMGGKPLTGYHLFMFFLVLLIFHIQFAMGMQWTLASELMAFAAYFLVCPYWDYMWFVLNPYYGRIRFRKENIWWHAKSKWFGRTPVDYVIGYGLSATCALAAGLLIDDLKLLGYHLSAMVMLIFAALPITEIAIAPLYHTWYWRMRQRDDRDKVDIFYNLPDKPLGKE